MNFKYLIYIAIIIAISGCGPKESDIYLNDNSPITPTNTNPSYKTKLKPYKVLGKWYYPREVNIGETFRGVASWYGPNFHGKLTANGEIYNMYAYTAANKILPMNTKVKVINLNNNKSVIVRINDRGPFVKGRIIDLSYIAGKKIGLDKTGTAPVKIIVLQTPNNSYKKTTFSPPKYQKNGKIKIQIGAFSSLRGAVLTKQKFNKFRKKIYIKKTNNIYKVFIGNFDTYAQAKIFKTKYNIKGFITQ